MRRGEELEGNRQHTFAAPNSWALVCNSGVSKSFGFGEITPSGQESAACEKVASCCAPHVGWRRRHWN